MRSTRRLAAAAALAVALAACGGGAPDVPHAVSRHSDASCLDCHLEGVDGAARTPHPESPNCVACHTPVRTADVGAGGLLPSLHAELPGEAARVG